MTANKTTVSAGASRFLTVSERIPYNFRYNVSADVDTYNADLRNKGGGVACDHLIDGNIIARDATTTSAWRTDAYNVSGVRHSTA